MTNQPPPHTHQCDLKKPATCREESDRPHNRLEEGEIAHINQTTQITITGEQDVADNLEDLAKEAGTGVNMIQL